MGAPVKFSKKLQNIMINKCKKFYGPGLSYFNATTIWNSVPVLMPTPVLCLIAQFNIKCKQTFSVSQKSRLKNEKPDLGLKGDGRKSSKHS